MTKTWRQPRPRKPPTREVRLKYPMPAGAGPFGSDVDPKDSESLRRLREIIDSEIGWASPEDEEAGDYEIRLKQVARELGALRDVRKRLAALLEKVDHAIAGGAGE